MKIEAGIAPKRIDYKGADRERPRNEMRPARGLLVGLVLSAIIWLGLLVFWLSV
ncbi:hypothetical protein SAMN05216566_12310 [Aureimonas phyllosphaerae]|uniref:Uncharacterized protein n=1 Tax=Aureimonas phyllosphaerae TaxID=1166078 RepID=A0A7W6FTV1_9HYPH|nr:hypothetical protein [Aureimonas phyllosphaerae]MBB3959426.1 hypothetical protein [Aureimonas phyllosphaerae]SFF53154.1 hypothetical protein SAMN05216566_12310 [Aureimonas phyllosphaerae]